MQTAPPTGGHAIRRFSTILTLLILLASLPAGTTPDWPHATEFRSRLAWVHPLVNYAIHPAWQRDWERHLLDGGGLQTTVGSVSTDDLCTILTVNLDQPLSGRFRFLYRGTWREGLHLDEDMREHWLGFEMAVVGPIGLHLQTHPTADKEEMDLRVGLVLTDDSRQRYLRLSLRLDDFIYEHKNGLGGRSESEAVGLQWEGRYAGDRWEIFSTGYYGSPSRRTYPDPGESPVLAASFRDRGASTTTVRYLQENGDFLAVGVDHGDFAAAESWRDPTDSYDYRNESVHLRIQYLMRTQRTFGLRPELHWLRQRAHSEGYWYFDHRRDDFFPALFCELRAPGRSTWELGYLASHYRWDFTSAVGPEHVDDFTDKVKLGWSYAFAPRALLQLSVSHEIDLDRFGGGNVQFQILF